MGFMTIALPSIKGYTGILVYVFFYGIGDGIFITTMNSILMFTVDEKRRAAALGLGFSLVSLGIAGGPPLAGEFLVIKVIIIQQIVTLSKHGDVALDICHLYVRKIMRYM